MSFVGCVSENMTGHSTQDTFNQNVLNSNENVSLVIGIDDSVSVDNKRIFLFLMTSDNEWVKLGDR